VWCLAIAYLPAASLSSAIIREATVLIFLFPMAFTSLLAALRPSENRNMG